MRTNTIISPCTSVLKNLRVQDICNDFSNVGGMVVTFNEDITFASSRTLSLKKNDIFCFTKT